jgi:hypothetical protein
MDQVFLDVVSTIWAQMSSLVTTISTTPLLLIGIAGSFASLIISIAMKLMGIRRGRRR